MRHGPFGPVAVAIPARDEEDEIHPCLHALAAQDNAGIDHVVICLNNTTDRTGEAIRAMMPGLPFAVEVLEVTLPAERACAGVARRIAMDRAADLAGPSGVVLTTDADGRVAPGWLACNLAALDAGAEAVFGRAVIDPQGAALIPAHLHDIDARECAYATLLDELAHLIDPDPHDSWPRHQEHSGASIAVTTAAYRRAAGMPPVCNAEDRAFHGALRRVDAAIRHDPGACVTVSARIFGRAQGGMADTIRRRMACVDEYLDDALEHVAEAARRAGLRARMRQAWSGLDGDPMALQILAAGLHLPEDTISRLTACRYFGTAWAEIEETSPVLERRRVRLADLGGQTARAQRLVAALHASRRKLRHLEDPAGMLLPDAAD